MPITATTPPNTALAIQQKQQQIAAQLVLLLSRRLPVCDWAISGLYGDAEGQADTVEAVRVWASAIAGGILNVTHDGAYLETRGVDDYEHIRVWTKRPVTPPTAARIAADASLRAAKKVLTRAADALTTQADADLVGAIRGAALLYTPFGPQASVLADAAIAAFVEHLHYSEGDPVAYLNQWVTIRTVGEIATELRVAGGRN